MATDRDVFEQAGLLDASVWATTPDRMDLLKWLDSLGFSVEEMVEADKLGGLVSLPGDRRLRPDADMSERQAAELLGINLEDMRAWQTGLGLGPVAPDTPRFSEREVIALGSLLNAGQFFTQEEAFHFARVLGSSMRRVAAAAVSLFLLDVERPLMEQQHVTELELAQKNLAAMGSVEQLEQSLGPLLRLHMEEAIRNARAADLDDEGRPKDTETRAVGFVDLVGFTAVGESISPRELGVLVRDFETKAFDTVAASGARVVKLIGDEVMFVALDASSAVRAAHDLLTAFNDHRVTPRGGVAYGEVLARGGDYYGSVVNMASRIADMAIACELLVTEAVAERAVDLQFEPAGRRQLKGFSDPVTLLSLSGDCP